MTLQVYELYYRRYQYTSTSCCVDVRDSLLLCHLCTFLSQSTRARVGVELQSAECGGVFKAKAVLKCRLVHTLSIHIVKWILNLGEVDIRSHFILMKKMKEIMPLDSNFVLSIIFVLAQGGIAESFKNCCFALKSNCIQSAFRIQIFTLQLYEELICLAICFCKAGILNNVTVDFT